MRSQKANDETLEPIKEMSRQEVLTLVLNFLQATAGEEGSFTTSGGLLPLIHGEFEAQGMTKRLATRSRTDLMTLGLLEMRKGHQGLTIYSPNMRRKTVNAKDITKLEIIKEVLPRPEDPEAADDSGADDMTVLPGTDGSDPLTELMRITGDLYDKRNKRLAAIVELEAHLENERKKLAEDDARIREALDRVKG